MQESTLPLRIDQGAIQDADELALFFLEEDIDLAMKFLEELEDAYENIRRFPHIYPHYCDGIARRTRLEKMGDGYAQNTVGGFPVILRGRGRIEREGA